MSAKLPSQLKRFADRALLSQIEENLELVEVELLEATKHTCLLYTSDAADE